jgi:carbon-monoxide dehydrogenase iron sulfur subunit
MRRLNRGGDMSAESMNQAAQGAARDHRRMRLIWSRDDCVGCRVCEAVCSFVKEGESNPAKSRCKIVRSVENNILYKYRVQCQQCETAACLAVCPAGAIAEDAQGVKFVEESKCIGCRMCEIACPIGAIFVVADRGVAVKCDLCRGLDGPQCAKFCFAGALHYVAEEKAGMFVARTRSRKVLPPQHEGDRKCR